MTAAASPARDRRAARLRRAGRVGRVGRSTTGLTRRRRRRRRRGGGHSPAPVSHGLGTSAGARRRLRLAAGLWCRCWRVSHAPAPPRRLPRSCAVQPRRPDGDDRGGGHPRGVGGFPRAERRPARAGRRCRRRRLRATQPAAQPWVGGWRRAGGIRGPAPCLAGAASLHNAAMPIEPAHAQGQVGVGGTAARIGRTGRRPGPAGGARARILGGWKWPSGVDGAAWSVSCTTGPPSTSPRWWSSSG